MLVENKIRNFFEKDIYFTEYFMYSCVYVSAQFKCDVVVVGINNAPRSYICNECRVASVVRK